MAELISTLNEFYKKLEGDDLKGDKFAVDGKVIIDSKRVNWKFRVIKNVTFNGLFTVSNVKIESGLAFIDCVFMQGIVVRGLESTNFDTSLNTYNTSLVFSNCKALQITLAELCKFDRGMLIENESEIGILKLYQTAIKSHGFNIRDSSISRHFDINQIKSSLKISNTKISKSLRISNSVGDISILKSKFHGSCEIWNAECPNSLVLNWNVFEDTFKISASRINRLSIHGDEFQKNFDLENRDTSDAGNDARLDELYITEANFMERGEIDGLGRMINKITLPTTPKLQGVLRLINWRVNEFSLSGISQNLKLLVSQMRIKRLTIIDFTNFGDITFDRSRAENENFKTEHDPNSSILTAHSDLGSAKFTEFDFASFDFISVDNTSFNDIFTSNVIWFDNDSLRIEESAESIANSFRRRREVYRQIKQSLRHSGNDIDFLMFRARELRAYRDELQSSEDYGAEDRLIMLTSMTNNYGLSWFKPLWIIALITFGFYLIELPLFSEKITYTYAKNVDDVKLTLSEVWNNFSIYWQLFNPARRFATVYKTEGTALLYFLDFFHRVILGVFIFQIIKAFRKYVSK